MKSILYITLAFFCSFSAAAQNISLIPKPASMQVGKGQFVISTKTVIATRSEADRQTARLLNDYLKEFYGFTLDIDRQEGSNYIRLNTRTSIQAPEKDGYDLSVNKDGVTIEGDTHTGTFYGMQTLLQLLPVQSGPRITTAQRLAIPFVTIRDQPRFSYRGMHLDVARHFFPVAFVQKYIDYLARHKFNYFHWHLTDDQGWRIEIKKYPELTSKGGFRNGTIVGRYPGTSNDNQRYGGFYTQEEVKQVVAYAAARHITVIPEIEMPGHSSAAIAAFPWLSCFPEQKTKLTGPISVASQQAQQTGVTKVVQETWGVFEDVYCAGKDSTFMFLENVLSEVLPLFPSRYIHIGGDESPKNHWKVCPRCQSRIRTEGLKDEHALQSYFVQRMEKFLNAQGRILIGWDEILEGGLAPNAVVMSWRGEKGGIEAAKAAHQVIMTPQKPVYFDHSQTRNEDSLTIGGFNPLEAVYAYEPVPKELDTILNGNSRNDDLLRSAARFIIGAQANLWTEYVPYPSKVEYKIFPRMTALSEVLWSPKEGRSWTDFEKRLPAQLARIASWGAHFSPAYYDLKSTLIPGTKGSGIQWKLKKSTPNGLIVYQGPDGQRRASSADSIMLPVSASGTWKVWLVEYTPKPGAKKGIVPVPAGARIINSPFSQTFYAHKALGKKATVRGTPNERYPGQGGAISLVNGIYSNKGLSHPDWLGYIGDDILSDIDLGKKETIDSIRVHTLHQPGSWVYQPQYVEIQLSSDGKNYTTAGRTTEFVNDFLTMGFMTVKLPRQSARYIRVLVKNYGMIPQGQPGAGNKSWVFADEIQVY